MKTTVSKYDFEQAFRDCGRENQFSYKALNLLFDWFEEYDVYTESDTELDVIAICCDFNEEPWSDIADNYGIDLTDCNDDGERQQAVENYLHDNTMLVGNTSDAIVYATF